MEKTYRHKKTGVIAKYIEDRHNYLSYYEIGPVTSYNRVPPFVVENGDDWELIEDKPAFALPVEDGGYITDKTQRVWVATKVGDQWYGETSTTYDSVVAYDFLSHNAANGGRVKAFRSRFARDQFIKGNNASHFEFITEDGFKVVTSEHKLNTLYLPTWKERTVTPAFAACVLGSYTWKFFYHRDNLLKYIEEHKPKPKVILTTEDGVEITDELQIVYAVTDDFSTTFSFHVRNVRDKRVAKVFSSAAKRDEYILHNKQLLSLSDVDSIIDKFIFFGRNRSAGWDMKVKFVELAKSKL